jgi:hypothetical protein
LTILLTIIECRRGPKGKAKLSEAAFYDRQQGIQDRSPFPDSTYERNLIFENIFEAVDRLP